MNPEIYSYRTLSTSGCFKPSPAPCMSNYGQRSVMDNMNFIEYVENSDKIKSTAVPAATGNIKMTIPPRSLEKYDPLTESPDSLVSFRGTPRHMLKSAPLIDNRYERSLRSGRKLLGTQHLAPGF
jgi:hypothetical protein